jgi:hypothetical protein
MFIRVSLSRRLDGWKEKGDRGTDSERDEVGTTGGTVPSAERDEYGRCGMAVR